MPISLPSSRSLPTPGSCLTLGHPRLGAELFRSYHNQSPPYHRSVAKEAYVPGTHTSNTFPVLIRHKIAHIPNMPHPAVQRSMSLGVRIVVGSSGGASSVDESKLMNVDSVSTIRFEPFYGIADSGDVIWGILYEYHCSLDAQNRVGVPGELAGGCQRVGEEEQER